MKKGIIVLVILLLCAVVYQANATDYYAQADAEITTAELWDTNPAGGGTDLTWASLANGDVLYANNHAITIANDIGSGSVTATLTTAAGTGTAGGSFTFDISAATAKTLYVNVTAGTTTALTVTGEGAGADTTELTINGDITGGSAAAAYGLRTGHTLGKIVITGDITGGSNATGYGISSSSAGRFAITGDSTGAAANGIHSGSTSVFTVAGNCVGSATSGGVGCYCGTGAGYCTVTGNLIGAVNVAATGKVRWTPSSAKNYVKFDGGGTAIYASSYLASDSAGTKITPANTAANVKTGTYFIKSDDYDGSTLTQGTATSGGGAWAN
jgi:hypothetical protein